MARGNTAMASEMQEQPEVLARLRRRPLPGLVEPGRSGAYVGILLIARGSSDHAAVYGRYVLELATRRPVVMAAPSLVTRYRVGTGYAGWLAVAVSQSGATPEIGDVLAAAAAGGAATLAITNEADSPLAQAAGATLWLGAGTEQAVPATKTVTAQMAAFALLAETLGDAPWRPTDWAVAIEAVRDVLDDDGPVSHLVDDLAVAPRLLCLARGLSFAVALETALKLAETTGRPASGMSTADFLHGPIEAADPDTHALCFVAPGPCEPDVREVVERLHARGSAVTSVAPEGVDAPVGGVLHVPPDVPEGLLPLVSVVRGQQIALALARALGRDPDHPPGLTKVTPTD